MSIHGLIPTHQQINVHNNVMQAQHAVLEKYQKPHRDLERKFWKDLFDNVEDANKLQKIVKAYINDREKLNERDKKLATQLHKELEEVRKRVEKEAGPYPIG